MTTVTAQAQRFREFRMPDVGEGLTEAEILKWYVAVGDTVHDGMVICEVETAKAAVELPIPYDGVVREIRFDEGTTVDVGTPIIVVDAGGDEAGPETVPAQPAPEPAAAEPAPAAEPAAKREAVLVGYGVAPSSTTRRPRKQPPAAPVSAPLNGHEAASPAPPASPAAPAAPESQAVPAAPAAPAERPLAKPPVRKLAKELGIDLATVVPTGPNGVVTREDIRAAAAPPAPLPAAPLTAPAAAGARETRTPIKGVRRATAQAMVASAFTAPHVTEFVTFDITRTMKLVQELKEDRAFVGLKVSPLLLVARALLVAIRRNPAVNATWDEDAQEIVQKSYVNLGIAAATPRGLIVPNIKDAQDRTLPELAAALGELVATAREGKTAPADMQGGTVTITNVGVFGVDTGTPILNPGESAILAFGAVKLQPWVHKGKVKPRHVTTLALSFDHRLVDGELGSKVLADVAAILEQPKRLITWA
ncbi:dihydrolipoamide acetyltransferase family protein [Streptomyces sp. NRRL F-5123]|uniref:dihydrolipoamide acetyltransferase family protein n=1 Tax=Streptomyces sp. NRRL F-5123 TaxID=1463856 RepID=UPI0004E1E1AC|nr:dihydrolipoamide acetyltransferase family protein [Streptomyces sp. NRRL F-5123]